MINCPVCGNTNPDDARFCAMCGEPLGQDVEAQPKEEDDLVIQWDGEGYCPLCRKRVRTYMGRCEFCGEPTSDMPMQHPLTQQTAPASAEQPPASSAIEAAVQQAIINMGIAPGQVNPEVKKQITQAVTSQLGGAQQARSANVSPTLRQQPPVQQQPIAATHKIMPEHQRETLRMGQQKKSLEKQKECFICLGTIGVDEEPVICPGCQMAYHKECAKDVGSCPNCGHKFDL